MKSAAHETAHLGQATETGERDAGSHIVEAAHSIAQIHAEHHQSASPHQRGIDRTTALLGKPRFTVLLIVLLGTWIVLNLIAVYFRYPALDPPPFLGLEAVVSLASLSIMLLVLATQRRENELAQKREQLTLELALLSEKKTAKIIELLEELRRDFPLVRDRIDEQAEAFAKPADPKRVIEAIVETHAAIDATEPASAPASNAEAD
jgi:uncharacterized membrane protein